MRQTSNYPINKPSLQFFHHNTAEKQSKVQGPVIVGWGMISYVRGLISYVGAWYWGSDIVGDVPTVVEFIASENRERFTPPTGCGHTWRFFSPIAATWHFNLVPRLQVPLLSSILKNHVIKSPNLIG